MLVGLLSLRTNQFTNLVILSRLFLADPSEPLVALLMLLAQDPPVRLAELDRMAAEPVPVPLATE